MLIFIDGQDFDLENIRDHQLIFTSNENLTLSINITADGHFEREEHFVVTLSTRILRLQLNTDSIKLKDSVCQGNGGSDFFSLSNSTDLDKEVNIALDHISLSRNILNDELMLILADEESERVTVHPAEAIVTIQDIDGKQTQF